MVVFKLSKTFQSELTFILSFGEGNCKHFYVMIALNSVKASICAFEKCSRVQLWEEGEGRGDCKYSSEFVNINNQAEAIVSLIL